MPAWSHAHRSNSECTCPRCACCVDPATSRLARFPFAHPASAAVHGVACPSQRATQQQHRTSPSRAANMDRGATRMPFRASSPALAPLRCLLPCWGPCASSLLPCPAPRPPLGSPLARSLSGGLAWLGLPPARHTQERTRAKNRDVCIPPSPRTALAWLLPSLSLCLSCGLSAFVGQRPSAATRPRRLGGQRNSTRKNTATHTKESTKGGNSYGQCMCGTVIQIGVLVRTRCVF